MLKREKGNNYIDFGFLCRVYSTDKLTTFLPKKKHTFSIFSFYFNYHFYCFFSLHIHLTFLHWIHLYLEFHDKSVWWRQILLFLSLLFLIVLSFLFFSEFCFSSFQFNLTNMPLERKSTKKNNWYKGSIVLFIEHVWNFIEWNWLV